jgi:pyridoxine kinase
MFKSWSYLDLTEEIKNIYDNWSKNDFLFDGFLLGYLGKKSLMDLAEQCFDRFSSKNAPKIIDPAFGDMGKLYGGFDLEYVKAMAHLLRRADVILPNMTEAAFLTGKTYKENYDKAYVEDMVQALTKITSGVIVITGIELDGKIGEVIYSNGKYSYVLLEKLPQSKHGTGDIFAAVFAADYLADKPLEECCFDAGKFVADCIRRTDDKHFYGVEFERVLNKNN